MMWTKLIKCWMCRVIYQTWQMYHISMRYDEEMTVAWHTKILLHWHWYATCPDMLEKTQKVPNFRAKNGFLSMIFSFLFAMYSSSPKEWKKAIVNEWCWYFFLWVIIWYALHTGILQKTILQQMTNVDRISWHLANITHV